MTEYDFVVVQMTKINARVLRFFHLNNARTRRVSALRCEKNKGQIISVINFIHIRHQRNNSNSSHNPSDFKNIPQLLGKFYRSPS